MANRFARDVSGFAIAANSGALSLLQVAPLEGEPEDLALATVGEDAASSTVEILLRDSAGLLAPRRRLSLPQGWLSQLAFGVSAGAEGATESTGSATAGSALDRATWSTANGVGLDP